MSKEYCQSYLIVVAFLSLFLFQLLGVPAFAENPKNPLVVLEPVKCDSPSQVYVGKALSEMLLTRLSSEDIDTVLVDNGESRSDVTKLADFVLTGHVIEKDGRFDASFGLRSPKNGKLIKNWDVRASSLGMLARNTSLLSAKIADTIKNAGEVLVADTVSSFAKLSGPGSKKIKTDDEFQMARLHPDILIRERLAKDQEREIREQEEGRRHAARRNYPVANEDDDSDMPFPDVYESENNPSQEELDNDQANKSASVKQKEEEDDSSFFPLPDVYDPDTDENAVDTPKKKAPETSVKSNNTGKAKGETVTTKEGSGKGNWYSRLWPFGKSENKKNPDKTVSEAKAIRIEKERRDKEPIVLSPGSRLPIPHPPQVHFTLPEPVPLDQALSKIENIKVQKRHERSWLARLWPWEKEEKAVVKTASSAQISSSGLGTVSQQTRDSDLHAFDSGSQIEALRRHVNTQRDTGVISLTPSEPVESPKKPGLGAGTDTVEAEGIVKTPSARENNEPMRGQVEGPIWQWN